MDLKEVAKQLAHPKGKLGVDVGLGMNHLNRRINLNTYKLLQLKDHENVLDIGIGNGRLISTAFKHCNNIFFTGIDISTTMIKEAKNCNCDFIETGKVKIIQSDIEQMPFNHGAYDKICTVNTIYFWVNPAKALNEVYRILASEGIFIIAFRPYVPGKSVDFSSYGFKEYTIEDVSALLQNTAFKVEEMKREDESPVEFDEKMHHLASAYFILRK